MEPREYEILNRFEEDYWWCKGIRRIISTFINKHGCQIKILDAGCGTAKLLEELSSGRKTSLSLGFDYFKFVLPIWKKKRVKNVLLASINEIPLKEGSFDIIICIDVLGSKEVLERNAIKELKRVLKKGGRLIVDVQAYNFLLSEHDRAVHSVRRYTKKKLVNLIQNEDLKIKKATYLFPTTFLPIVVYRTMRKFKKKNSNNSSPSSDFIQLPSIINKFLYNIVLIELFFLKRINFPFGTSVFCVAERQS